MALKETEQFTEEFTTVIEKVTVEIIDEENKSHPEIHYNLMNNLETGKVLRYNRKED